MRFLIFEDEIHNFRMLEFMLKDIDPDCEVIGPLASVAQGREYLMNHKDFDMIIADIQLGDGLSFEALRDVPVEVPIIFTTAYENFALQAFEYNSLSYLLKPIDEDELAKAIKKARKLSAHDGSMNTFLPSGSYRERFVVKMLDREKVISTSDILYIYSEGKCSYAKLKDGFIEILDMSLEKISSQLDPAKFMRVSRKYIVPLECVAGTRRLSGGKERLEIKGDPAVEVVVSRERRREVRKWLEGES